MAGLPANFGKDVVHVFQSDNGIQCAYRSRLQKKTQHSTNADFKEEHIVINFAIRCAINRRKSEFIFATVCFSIIFCALSYRFVRDAFFAVVVVNKSVSLCVRFHQPRATKSSRN